MTTVVVLAFLGLGGMVVGTWALVAAFLPTSQFQQYSHWWLWRSAMLVVGVLSGWATWRFPLVLGYHRTFDDGRWWFAGLPFFEACFDSRGRDFIGEFTLPAAIGNVVFWFLVPQIVLSLFVRLYSKRHPLA